MKLSELTSHTNEALPAAIAGLGALGRAVGPKLLSKFKKSPPAPQQSTIINPATGKPFSPAAPAAPAATAPAATAPAATSGSGLGKTAKSVGSWALKHPKTTYAGTVLGRAAMDDESDSYAKSVGSTVGSDIDSVLDLGRGMYKSLSGDKKSSNVAKDEEPFLPQYTDLEPEDDEDDDIGKTNENIENLVSILKLSGQRAITERDNTVGIIKPKQIKTLTESAGLSECGGTMSPLGSSTQPATLNISATASNGDEVANMLKSIMQLAGVKPVTPDMMPKGEILPIVKPEPVLGTSDSLPSGEVCDQCGHNPCECAMEETYDNTPEEHVEPYDPNNMAHVINKVSSKDLASTPYQSASNPLSEEPKKEEKKVAEDVYHGLFRAYQEFKNRQ